MSPTIKSKITFDDMIQHFKNKNVSFNSISEAEAKEILQERTYFFKLKSYKNNFDRDKHGNFKKLDFGMLMDFSIIDMHLRTFVLNVSLSIEHTLKTKLLKIITDDPNEDGYKILLDFINHHNTKGRRGSTMTMDSLWGKAHIYANRGKGSDLYKAYKNSESVWIMFEVITFGTLVEFAEFYKDTRSHNIDIKLNNVITNLKYVKFLRNIAAHSSPLIINLRNLKFFGAEPSVTKFLTTIPSYDSSKEQVFLKNRVIHHFVAMLFVFENLITSKGVRKNVYRELIELTKRCRRNSSFYVEPIYEDLISKYIFIRKIARHLKSKNS